MSALSTTPQPQPWLQTHRGSAFPLLDPDPSHVDFNDIADSLSTLCRFNGHCQGFYSVAQHSVLVMQILIDAGQADIYSDDGRKTLLYALLHDGHEAYMGDITTPMREAIATLSPDADKAIKTIAARIDAAIFYAAGLAPTMPPKTAALIKTADQIALATERRDVLADGPEWGIDLPPPMKRALRPQAYHLAHDTFLMRFRDLTQWHENAAGDRHRLT